MNNPLNQIRDMFNLCTISKLREGFLNACGYCGLPNKIYEDFLKTRHWVL